MKNYLIAANVSLDNFMSILYIKEDNSNVIFEIEIDKFEDIVKDWIELDFIVNIQLFLLSSCEVSNNDKIEYDQLRWYDLDWVLVNGFPPFKQPEQYIKMVNQLQRSLEYKKDIPFKIILMKSPMISVNDKTLYSKSVMIKTDYTFLSKSEIEQHIIDNIIKINPENKDVYIYSVNHHISETSKASFLRVRMAIDDITYEEQ